MFKKNEGNIDRILRVVVGLVLVIAFFMLPEASYRLWLLVGIIPLVTGLMGSCPLYSILGVSTCPMKDSE